MNWEEVKKWEEESNYNKTDEEPIWAWDSNFKLDYDGGIITVSSRFYPPNYASSMDTNWAGTISILLLNKQIESKNVKCASLEELREVVENYVKDYIKRLKSKIL